ncbi:unnamed protein product [Lactuca virosa]|uniref:FCP1 homology domain-containing protein n=1 Tax=Lactuca virosa TaxID=75947 RepID=A0AAU9P1P0_9ASTR|nr:unnamed protein product [Lactuca virosa]
MLSVEKLTGADHHTSNDSIFKRPHLDSFWEFCFERFNVDIRSTKYKINVLAVVEFLLPNFNEKLLFIWDVSRCTKTKMNTIDNNKKPIEFKYLGKFWESNGPYKSWIKGDFNKLNTLLVDDSPLKSSTIFQLYDGFYGDKSQRVKSTLHFLRLLLLYLSCDSSSLFLRFFFIPSLHNPSSLNRV